MVRMFRSLVSVVAASGLLVVTSTGSAQAQQPQGYTPPQGYPPPYGPPPVPGGSNYGAPQYAPQGYPPPPPPEPIWRRGFLAMPYVGVN